MMDGAGGELKEEGKGRGSCSGRVVGGQMLEGSVGDYRWAERLRGGKLRV